MESKADALVLRATDYGEYDKMVTLLTAERGKIGAALKGVRRAGAKLKFAAQPFCFAEYVLASRGGRNTVTSAALHDGFYALREDVTRYYAGAVVLSVCDKIALEGMESGELLVAAVTALEEIAQDEPLALVRFLAAALAFAGYPVSAEECPVCGRIPSGRMRFDFSGGTFLCEGCSEEGVPASESTYRTVRALTEGGEVTADGVVRALRLLGAYFAFQVGADIEELAEYLRLLRG
ncbi:MAG TPA: DNA repair protein RecO [Firmicutes bacterium]|nr:DNA repair protein RecO [Bacillota bacterium]